MEKTAEKLTGLVDVNTVIGKAVGTASGAQVIPFTKVTMGVMAGFAVMMVLDVDFG